MCNWIFQKFIHLKCRKVKNANRTISIITELMNIRFSLKIFINIYVFLIKFYLLFTIFSPVNSIIIMFFICCRYADQIRNGDKVLVEASGQFTPVEVINVSSFIMQCD